ncbi:MAG TPA: FeoB small GTPase domain-containing protein, partial [Methanomassiliicoccales archaeon]|nr:FeoB small GTPase domain-containing protein [Methanomassiliicoccales archaeon]
MEIGLIGQPNVGKSVLFSRLTGIGVISSNYPGTTVEFQEGAVVHHGKTLNFHDLPGTYSLAGGSEDEEVATRLLAEKELDAVVVVIDASRLEQGLVLLFQLIELGFRVVVALNMMDIARKRFTLDVTQLEEQLRVPIVPTVALTGEGVEQLVEVLVKSEFGPSTFSIKYDRHIEDDLKELSVGLGDRIGKFPIRGGLIKLLEGNPFFTEQFPQYLLDSATQVRRDFEKENGEDIAIHISRDRYGEAGRIAKLVIAPKPEVKTRADRISALTIRPSTGIPIM